MSQITTAEALAMMAECFMETPENLRSDMLRSALPGWDSMGALMLIAELDERFELELSAEDSRQMTQVADVLAFLDKHGHLAKASDRDAPNA